MMVNKDDKKKDGRDLAGAKKELSEMRSRPIEIDETLAVLRARQERERVKAREALAQLEKEHERARQVRHQLRMKEVERNLEVVQEKEENFEEERRTFEKQKGARSRNKDEQKEA